MFPSNKFPLPRPSRSTDHQEHENGLPPKPKRKILPDDSWHKGKALAVPERSPLREYFAVNSSLQARNLSPLSEPSDEETRARLKPLPLHLPKSTLGLSAKATLQPKTNAPPEAQAVLEEPPTEVSPRTHDFVIKKVISQSSITESNKHQLAADVEAEEAAFINRQRKLTLEALEGAPTPTVEFCPENLLKVMSPSTPSTPVEPTPRSPGRELVSVQTQLIMDSLHPDSAAAMTRHRREAIRLAKTQERAVADKCKRSNQDTPRYSFDELIGKGSFGRVYKGFGNSLH